MNTIYINSGVLDAGALKKIQDLDTSQKTSIYISDKTGTFTLASKVGLLTCLLNINETSGLTIDTLGHEDISTKTKESLRDVLYLFSSDYMRNSSESASKISCYERSIANIIGRYHRSKEHKPEHCEHFVQELASYFQAKPTSELVQHYLTHPGIKEDSLRYINNLQPTRIKTIDNIITKEINGEPHILIGERKDYPLGSALLGGFIDYDKQGNHQSDQTKADELGLHDLSLITNIREGIEEASGIHPEHLSISYKIETHNNTSLLIGTEETSGFSVGVDISQTPIDYIEDPLDFSLLPADARGPVTNRARHMSILQGEPSGSDDISSVTWVAYKDIDQIDFAMPHHPVMIHEYFSKK